MRIKARRVVPPIQNNRHPASDVAPLAYPSGKAQNAGELRDREASGPVEKYRVDRLEEIVDRLSALKAKFKLLPDLRERVDGVGIVKKDAPLIAFLSPLAAIDVPDAFAEPRAEDLNQSFCPVRRPIRVLS
jgi:hypothetical protein